MKNGKIICSPVTPGLNDRERQHDFLRASSLPSCVHVPCSPAKLCHGGPRGDSKSAHFTRTSLPSVDTGCLACGVILNTGGCL